MQQLLTAVLFVSSTLKIAAAADCCSYPLSSPSVHSANVTGDQFQCSEPVQFTCNYSDGFFGIVAVGNATGAVAGDAVAAVNIVTMVIGTPALVADAECHVDSGLWTLGPDARLWANFACGDAMSSQEITVAN